jgi:iron(III) transport system ATP-binding protein
MSFLSIRALGKHYGGTAAVDGVDLDVAPGSRTVIVGPSGCGKTTLLRLIAGFEAPSRGRITLDGRPLAQDRDAVPAHLRNVGFVAQDGALFPHLSVAANIGFGLDRAADREDRVDALMAAVGLPPAMRERRPHQLSGGQQQRVALARALARRPKLMLLDEPFSALDTGLRESVREMVGAALAAAGIATVLVTHDQAEALSFADHLAVMREGRLVQAGPPIELYQRPADVETALFLGEAIILEADLLGGRARCALGEVAVDAPGRSGRAMIMLRPEQVSLRPTGVPAKVVARSFRGSGYRLLVEPQPGARRIALTAPVADAPPPGAMAMLAVSGAAHVLDGARAG